MRREEFPPLQDDLVYLDSACMSLRPETVIEKVREYYTDYPGCSGRSHHQLSKSASEELGDARKRVAEFIDADQDDMVFTSGTTEAINTVASGFSAGKVIISDREHNSNLVPWQKNNREIETVSTRQGFDLESLEEKIGEGDLLSLVHVSNLDGFEVPVEEAVKIARENDAYTLIDAAQSIPHQPFSVEELSPDFVAFSGHKMLGPSGTGALYVSQRCQDSLEPLKYGGGAVKDSTYTDATMEEFPDRMEPGLPNLAGFIGMGEAAGYLREIGMKRVHRHEQKLTEKLLELFSSIEEVETFCEGTGVISFKVEGMDSHQVALMLDRQNIAVRSGMHCVHSWFNDREEEISVRASLHLYNNERDVERLAEEVKKIAAVV